MKINVFYVGQFKGKSLCCSAGSAKTEFIKSQPTFQSYDELCGACWFTEFSYHDKMLYTNGLKSLFVFKQLLSKFHISSECFFRMLVGSEWFGFIFFG